MTVLVLTAFQYWLWQEVPLQVRVWDRNTFRPALTNNHRCFQIKWSTRANTKASMAPRLKLQRCRGIDQVNHFADLWNSEVWQNPSCLFYPFSFAGDWDLGNAERKLLLTIFFVKCGLKESVRKFWKFGWLELRNKIRKPFWTHQDYKNEIR